MKKLCILLALLLPAFVLCACVDKPQTQQLSALSVHDLQPDQAAVIVKEGETFLVCTVTLGRDTDASNGEQLLQYLSDEGILSVTWQQSDYGKYLLSVGGAVADESKNQFIAIYTSVEKDKGAWAGVPSYEADGVKLVSAAVGISQLTVEGGAVLYFEVSSY